MQLVKNSPVYWDFIRDVRFDPANVSGFVENKPVTPEQQEKYMQKHEHNYWVCLIKDEPVGFVGIVDGDIRIAVCPKHQEKGIGSFMLREILKMDKPHTAKILLKNTRSLILFLKSGYIPYKTDNVFIYLKP